MTMTCLDTIVALIILVFMVIGMAATLATLFDIVRRK